MARYITIEREYWSGGRYIANKLAAECKINCYGRKILEGAANILHIPCEQLEKYEENSTNSLLYSVAMIGKSSPSVEDMLMKDGKLFVAEQETIHNFAANGPAVFLGHCASEALKDHDDVIKVFIKSNVEDRRKRICEEYGVSKNEVDNLIKKYDKKRSNYYAANTKHKWRDLNNYDVILDTSVIDLDSCVTMLKALYFNAR